ncbi:futalosine hydrolase [Geobacter pickeringii]|uniref:Futalosine hydrolase n=1 Tax=Geobacter pickeringii TaxID=345632 RepID=A0A0B5BCX2_9BACT|nr:futalosine hydrolase [Geobacter pickeringii]AJE04578.1 futalosine hydrolase [Geobacter pickeringii]
MGPVVICAATFPELALLIRSIGARKRGGRAGRETYAGSIGKQKVVLAVTGIGKVNTASALTVLLETSAPRLVINVGCAGAFTESGLRVGDLAVASAEVYGDEGVQTPDGWEPLDLIGIPSFERKGVRYFNEFPLAKLPAEQAVQLAGALGITARRGRFLTVSTCSGTLRRGDELFRRFSPLCENMEGAAAAHVSLIYGVDCLEVRGISNMVEDRDLSRWNIPLAVEKAQRFILKFLETYP